MRYPLTARAFSALTLCLLCLLAGCSEKQKQEQLVREGVKRAKRLFEETNTNPAAKLSFASACESGGSALSYLTANLGDATGLPTFAESGPEQPYTVLVGFDNNESCFVIAGYTDSTNIPAIIKKVPYTGGGKARKGARQAAREELNAELLLASESGATGTVRALLARGADLNARSNEGGTPLIYACARTNGAVVQLLLEAGADPKAVADDANGWPVILFAAQAGDETVMAALLAKGADPNASDRSGNTAISLSAMRGNAELVERLAQAGANPDVREIRQGNFALLHAVSRGHAAVVAALLKHGANVNLADKSGMTPLILCAQNGTAEIAGVLLDAKADTEAKLTGAVGSGATALMIAAARGHEEVVRLLLAHGANPRATDEKGSTPARYAQHNGQQKLAERLEGAGGGSPAKRPGPAAATGTGAKAATPLQASGRATLIGKEQKDADAMLGKPIGSFRKGDLMVILYREAQVTLKENVIVDVGR